MSARDVREQAAVLVRAWEGGLFDTFRERWGWSDPFNIWTAVEFGRQPRNFADLGGVNGRRREAWALALDLFGESPRKGLELLRAHGLVGDEVVRWLGLPPVRHWGRPL